MPLFYTGITQTNGTLTPPKTNYRPAPRLGMTLEFYSLFLKIKTFN